MIHEKENSRSDFNPNLGGSFLEILSVLLGHNKQYVDSMAGGWRDITSQCTVSSMHSSFSSFNVKKMLVNENFLIGFFYGYTNSTQSSPYCIINCSSFKYQQLTSSNLYVGLIHAYQPSAMTSTAGAMNWGIAYMTNNEMRLNLPNFSNGSSVNYTVYYPLYNKI